MNIKGVGIGRGVAVGPVIRMAAPLPEPSDAPRAELEADGWKVIVVWACELGKKVRDERLERLYREIVDDSGKADDSGE